MRSSCLSEMSCQDLCEMNSRRSSFCLGLKPECFSAIWILPFMTNPKPLSMFASLKGELCSFMYLL